MTARFIVAGVKSRSRGHIKPAVIDRRYKGGRAERCLLFHNHQNKFNLLNNQVRRPGLLELETIPLPSNLTSMWAIAVDGTILAALMSTWRTTPRIAID